jgi:hypothetical protein
MIVYILQSRRTSLQLGSMRLGFSINLFFMSLLVATLIFLIFPKLGFLYICTALFVELLLKDLRKHKKIWEGDSQGQCLVPPAVVCKDEIRSMW